MDNSVLSKKQNSLASLSIARNTRGISVSTSPQRVPALTDRTGKETLNDLGIGGHLGDYILQHALLSGRTQLMDTITVAFCDRNRRGERLHNPGCKEPQLWPASVAF